jgi:hypothetical protein
MVESGLCSFHGVFALAACACINGLSRFNLCVVDLAKGPAVLGSLARSTTPPVFYLDRALV